MVHPPGGTQIERDWVIAGLAISDDAELTAVSMGIISASEKLGEDFNLASNIHIYSDSINVLNRATDCSAHSGQTWSVALMEVIGPWLTAFPDVSLMLHHVPKDAEWTPHFRVHKYVTALRAEAGHAPLRTVSYDYKSLTDDMLKSWREQFLKLSYIGHVRLKPLRTSSAILSPTHIKGGPWMRLVHHRTMLTARLVRALPGHAPVVSFRQCFGFTETDACACGLGSETVGHVIHQCSEYTVNDL